MSGTCDHTFVFLVRCGAMACIECAQHVSLANYTAMQKRPSSRRYHHDECTCGWAEDIKEENDD